MLAVNAVSCVPFAFSRTKLPARRPFHISKSPPRIIFPSACTAIDDTSSSAPLPIAVPNASSTVPSAFNRTT